jgi:riboflavin synthase
MFTGLIETMGTVAHLQKLPGGARLTIAVPQFAAQLELGDSIAVNGCCVTVVECDATSFTADLVPESLARTNLGVLTIGSEVNVERAMAVGDRFGGHWVQGHVDCLGQVRSRKRVGTEELLEITVPFELTRFIVGQGSITLDGVSLTVVDCGRDRFRVALIPHTRELTTLGRVQPMDVVNVEIDVLAKYLEKHMTSYVQRLPRMLREATAQNGSAQPAVEEVHARSTITPPIDGHGSVSPAKRTVAAAAPAATIKRDRPKVRRSSAAPIKKAPATKAAAPAKRKPAVKKTTARKPVRKPAVRATKPTVKTKAKRVAASRKATPRRAAPRKATAKRTTSSARRATTRRSATRGRR